MTLPTRKRHVVKKSVRSSVVYIPEPSETLKKTVFAVSSNTDINPLRAPLFSTLEKARKHLKSIADDRRYKMGVEVVADLPDKFSFLFGWEEHLVSFTIIELPVDDK